MSPARAPRPTAIDLFSGAGGLTRGLRDAGFNVLAAVEVDDLAAETYQLNFPHVHLWKKDIRKVTVAEVSRRLDLAQGKLDLLAACPPCEGFSTMRTLNGHLDPDDERNDLVLQLPRFIRQLRPKTVLVENVPALARDARLRTIENVLADTGYDWRCEVVNAADFGVPQRRRRMLLVASRLGSVPPMPSTQPRTVVRDWIGGLSAAGTSGDPLHDHGESRSAGIVDIIRRVPKDGGGRRDLPASFQLECHTKCDGFKDVYGRMAWDDIAPTITGGCVNPSKGRFLHPTENRAITLREAALLQTFPEDHLFSLRKGKFAAAELIGNALPPHLVEVQAAALLDHLSQARR